jgi:acyl dehydratase
VRPEPAGSVMATRELRGSPRILPLYARAAAATFVPGAGRLPFLPGGGDGAEVPTDVDLELAEMDIDADHLAGYAKVCRFALRDDLPATYLHVVAFPLHLALMGDGRFPFGAVGLIHVANRIERLRPVRLGERLSVRVRATALEPHRRGRSFTIVSEARAGEELVWTDVTTILRREATATGPGDGDRARAASGARSDADPEPRASSQWRLPGDLGRRYAGVSGDRNPIHMHDLPAKLLGFPRTIAHGMWTKARCLAALESRLPPAFAVEARFRKAVLLPSTVTFGSAEDGGGAIRFAVRSARDGTPHLDGRVEPLARRLDV